MSAGRSHRFRLYREFLTRHRARFVGLVLLAGFAAGLEALALVSLVPLAQVVAGGAGNPSFSTRLERTSRCRSLSSSGYRSG